MSYQTNFQHPDQLMLSKRKIPENNREKRQKIKEYKREKQLKIIKKQ